MQLLDLKTARSRRTIPMPPALVTALRQHKRRQAGERLLAGERWQDWGLVFPTSIGTPTDARNLVTRYKAMLGRAGLPDLRFHDLRHSCLSLLAAQGIPARTAMEIAGHSDIRLTQNVYTHIHDESKRQAADAMERLFGTA